MKIKDGKIVEATEEELFDYWLKRFDDIMSFSNYKERCEELGTKIIKKSTRDPNRIPEIINELMIAWQKVPDWRLCQLIVNVASNKEGSTDPFYLEDDEFLKLLKETIK